MIYTKKSKQLIGTKQTVLVSRTKVIKKKIAQLRTGTPQETELELPFSVLVSHVEVWVNSRLPQGQGLWIQQTWEAQYVA